MENETESVEGATEDVSSLIDPALRARLLEALSPVGWKLLSSFFFGPNSAVKTRDARTSVEVEDFLTELMGHDDFKTAIERQAKQGRSDASARDAR